MLNYIITDTNYLYILLLLILCFMFDDFDDIYDCMADLMGMTWDIDARIEPHPIKTEDYDSIATPFVQEVIDTGIKVA